MTRRPRPVSTDTGSGTAIGQTCLDDASQSLLGSIPSMPAGNAGHKALLDVYFDLVALIAPDVICDIGANKGEAGRRALAVLPRAQVFGFEANPEIHAANAAVNTGAGVSWINAAVADRTGTIDLHIPVLLARALIGDTLVKRRVKEARTTGKSSLLKRDEDARYRTVTVPAVTLDDHLTRHAPDGRVALWIDVEGAASTVLKGAARTLERTDLVVVEVEGFGFWQDQALALAVLRQLQAAGLQPVLRDREYNDAQFNVICLRATANLTAQRQKIGRAVQPKATRPDALHPGTVPVLIPCFNNPTYCDDMLAQLLGLGFRDITFVDNASDNPTMHLWLDRATREGATVERLAQNLGPRGSIFTADRLSRLPRYFCVTDPDLRFNQALPDDFLAMLAETISRHGRGKAGFALDISDPSGLRQDVFYVGKRSCQIWEWEQQFWASRLGFTPGGDPIYRAKVDTTFALYDKTSFRPNKLMRAVRVGGRFTAIHLPWLADQEIEENEARHYRKTQKFSYYLR